MLNAPQKKDELEKTDAFLVKYDVDGNQLWNTTWGGPDGDRGRGIAVNGIFSIAWVTTFFGVSSISLQRIIERGKKEKREGRAQPFPKN
jgi:hypothetical protein